MESPTKLSIVSTCRFAMPNFERSSLICSFIYHQFWKKSLSGTENLHFNRKNRNSRALQSQTHNFNWKLKLRARAAYVILRIGLFYVFIVHKKKYFLPHYLTLKILFYSFQSMEFFLHFSCITVTWKLHTCAFWDVISPFRYGGKWQNKTIHSGSQISSLCCHCMFVNSDTVQKGFTKSVASASWIQ